MDSVIKRVTIMVTILINLCLFSDIRKYYIIKIYEIYEDTEFAMNTQGIFPGQRFLGT